MTPETADHQVRAHLAALEADGYDTAYASQDLHDALRSHASSAGSSAALRILQHSAGTPDPLVLVEIARAAPGRIDSVLADATRRTRQRTVTQEPRRLVASLLVASPRRPDRDRLPVAVDYSYVRALETAARRLQDRRWDELWLAATFDGDLPWPLVEQLAALPASLRPARLEVLGGKRRHQKLLAAEFAALTSDREPASGAGDT